MTGPTSPWADESMWLPDVPETPTETERSQAAEAVVRALGFSEHTTFVVSELGAGVLELRPCRPASSFPAPGAPSYFVGPDDRVYIVPAVPGTVVLAAEKVLVERYSNPAPVAEQEHSRLENRIRAEARDLSSSWG